MKTVTTLLAVTLASATLALTPTAHAGHQEHDRTFQLVCELERETDHLIDDLKRDFRHHGHPTCSRSPEGRLFRALKEVEEQTDTLHYRIRKNRSACAQAEAFAAIRCAFEQAEGLLSRVRLDRHVMEVIDEVGCRIDRLAREFDQHGHARARTQPQLHDSRPYHYDADYAQLDYRSRARGIETLLLARLLQSLGH